MINDLLIQLKPWLAWLHIHPYWVGIATFFIAFVECLAVVGLVVPGTVIMTAIGAMIGSDVVSARMVFIPAMLGALLGDVISFWIGYHYRERLREVWPFKFYPRLLQKGESFFYRHGGKGVFVGRFLGPIRPMLPLIAGMLNMPPVRFFVADSISAVFWAPIYTLPGILLGMASVELAPKIAMHLMLYVILILLIFWCISWLIKRMIQWGFSCLHNLLDKLWEIIKHKPFLQPLHIALQDPLHPESHAQLTLGLYFILMAVLFLLLTINVALHCHVIAWNYPLLFFMRSLHSPSVYHFFLLVTLCADPKVWASVFIVMFSWFIIAKAYRTAGHWMLGGLLSIISIPLVKHMVHFLRPWGLTVTPSGFSYPSGHTAVTGIITGFLAVLLSREMPKTFRFIPFSIAVIVTLLTAFSRLYLGAHWLTDVIGGILLAFTIIMLITLSYRRRYTPALNPIYAVSIFIVSWALSAGIYSARNYHKFDYNYSIYTPAKIISQNFWWNNNGREETLFRLNRLGKPAQVFNLQWVGDLKNIQQALQLKGWQPSPNTTLGTILNRMSEQTKKLELPVVPQLYLDKRPMMIMTKIINSNSLLLLTLWDSQTRFNDSGHPLWLGNIAYYHIWQTGYFHLHSTKMILPAQTAMSLLIKDLDPSAFIWKQLNYCALASQIELAQKQNKSDKLNWNGQIMLVVSKDV